MEFTAEQIANVIGGRVEGNKDAKVHTFAKIEEGTEGAISFLSNPKYTHYLYKMTPSPMPKRKIWLLCTNQPAHVCFFLQS